MPPRSRVVVEHPGPAGVAQRCRARGFTPLPADPAAVCAYLTERAAAGTAVASLGVACCGIGFVHRTHGLANPIGRTTAAYAAGVHPERIAAQTRHNDLSVLLNRYIRPLDALASTSSRDLGL